MKTKKAVFAGIGLIHQAAERAEELAEELIERGQLKRKDSRGFIKIILERAQGERTEFQTVVREIVQDIFESLGVASRAEVDAMISRLDRLEKRVNDNPSIKNRKAKSARKIVNSQTRKKKASQTR